MMAEVFTWIPDGGAPVVLPVRQGVEGRGLPASTVDAVQVFGEAGERRLRQTFEPRDLVVPVVLTGANVRDAVRALGCQLDTTGQPGRLQVQADDATDTDAREVVASMVGGFELVEDVPGVIQAALVFRAHDPFWLATSDTTITVGLGGGVPFFDLPPFQLAPPAIVASPTVTIGCDAEVFPRITLRGPATSLRFTNQTTSQVINLPDLSLDAGETVTIDTRPGRRTVTGQDGTNLFALLTVESTLWTLRPGANQLSVLIDDVTEQTKLTVRFRDRFVTA